MADKGFVKLNRGFFENPFWKEKRTYSNAEAWIDLIQSARFENTQEKILVKMKIIIINRGELRASQRYLAERWGWSVGKVNRFINVLEMERMVERRVEHSETIVKLCNYGLYNTDEKKKMNTNRHTDGELNETPTEQQQIQTKESKELKEGKELKNFLLEKETKENLGNSDFDDSIKTPEPEKEKKVAPKKENPKPPDLAEFLDYAKETYQNELKRDFSPFAFAVRSKYESWINADWKDGNGKQIKNWKSKLKNTIPHLKPIYNGTNNYTAGAVNGNQKPAGKVSARTVLAQRLNAANATNSESGNITIDIEAQ